MIYIKNVNIVEVWNIEDGKKSPSYFTFTFKNDTYTEPKWYFTSKEKLKIYLKYNNTYPEAGIY